MTTSEDSNKTPPEPASGTTFNRRDRAHRTMAIVRWILLALVTVVAGYSVWTYWGPGASTHPSHREDRYYCPMHPQIRSPDPGECPICHMNLEPIPEHRQADGAAAGAAPDMRARPNAPPDVVPVALTTERQQLIGVTTTVATRAALGQELRVPGSVEAPESGLAQVRSRAAGFIERVAVRETGVRVSRGQPLAWIYSPDIYRAQEEFLAASRWAAGAGTPSSASGTSPSEMAAAARRALELLGLSDSDIDEISRSGRSMRAIPVRAPISGHVTRFNAILGLHASPETTLYEIADLSRVWVIASVHERDLPHVRAGMPARFTSTSQPNDSVAARVELVEPEVSETTRTARVRLTIQNPKFELRPGQYGDVMFELPESTALVVPKDAVIHTGTHAYVFVDVGSGRFEPRTVRVGTQAGDRVQILEGVAEGDRVVSRGSFMLDSESRLQASLAAAPAPSPGPGGARPAELGPACEEAFDQQKYPDKFNQCRLCERQHAGMGNMVADCKNAIARPWR
ncbi:MAG: efflux RND transporter periplasmic adaptor subunit [Deltaproteobacteria bacterium]